tara:strand:- start:25629 stop:25730 length:102 start_codon:yes stop_codon:yes gene_type:complete
MSINPARKEQKAVGFNGKKIEKIGSEGTKVVMS